jgi:cell wall-associated NlpC family hydrolase
LTKKAGILYASPVRIIKNSRGAPASAPARHLPSIVGFKGLVVTAALLAPLGAAVAAPQAIRQPALRAVDDRGLLDSVADKSSQIVDTSSHLLDKSTQLLDKGTQLISQVRDGASGLVDSAMNFLGVRYKLGGNSAETGFDCSGFTRYVFENSIGRVLPHRADEQANDPRLAKVDQKDLKPGDLVFFNTMRRTFSHVGIYLGDGKFIHSPRTGESVRIEDINISYWARHFTGARRVPELENANGTPTDSGKSMLASLTARLSGQGSTQASTLGTAAGASTLAPLVSASLNPSGLKVGSTLPEVASNGVAGFAPAHGPAARAMGSF